MPPLTPFRQLRRPALGEKRSTPCKQHHHFHGRVATRKSEISPWYCCLPACVSCVELDFSKEKRLSFWFSERFQRHGKTAGVFSKGKEDKRKNKHQQHRQPHSTAHQHNTARQHSTAGHGTGHRTPQDNAQHSKTPRHNRAAPPHRRTPRETPQHTGTRHSTRHQQQRTRNRNRTTRRAAQHSTAHTGKRHTPATPTKQNGQQGATARHQQTTTGHGSC